MTELHFRNTEECINRIKSIKEMYVKDTPSEVALREAINALEEVEKYRNIGVVSSDELEQDLLLYKADREIFSMYNSLGTVEELRVAKEKQIPKKQGSLYADDSHLYIDCDGFVRCFKTKKDIRYPLISLSDLDYCPRCGQKLDWESDTD